MNFLEFVACELVHSQQDSESLSFVRCPLINLHGMKIMMLKQKIAAFGRTPELHQCEVAKL